MLINTVAGVEQIDHTYWADRPHLLGCGRQHGATGGRLVRRVILPGSLPMVLTGLRLAVSSVLMVAIAAEMLSAQVGLGATIWLVWQTRGCRDYTPSWW